MRPMLRVPDHPLLMARFGLYSGLPAALLKGRFTRPEAQALWAGVAAHAFRPFSAPMSSAIGVALGTAAHAYGWPVAEGGSGAISAAMISMLEEHGATFETGVRVNSLAELDSADVVMLDVAPAAAARIAGDRMPRRIARALTRYRHGPGAFKVDFAIQGGVPWAHEASRRAGTVHVGGGYREIADAEAVVARGAMPDRPFVLVCQQYLADPGRSNGDVHPLYAYAHVPAGYTGDVTAQIEAQIERFAPGFRERILARHVRSVAQMEAHNVNYVGGDVVDRLQRPAPARLPPARRARPVLRRASPASTCARRRPRPAPARMACAVTTRRNSALRRLGHRDQQPLPLPLDRLETGHRPRSPC